MLPPELEKWRSLPDRLTIYRGALTYTAREAAQGISWSLTPGYPSAHLYRRTLPAHDATEIRALLGQNPPTPHLISIEAPKSAILAAVCSYDRELLVDYEKLDPAQIKSLPAKNLLLDAVFERIGDMRRAFSYPPSTAR